MLARDLGAVEDLCAAVFADDRVGAGRITRDFVLAGDFDPDNLLIAEAVGGFAGFALLCPDSVAPVMWLVAFGVVPEMRGRGIGKALLDQAMARVQTAGAARVGVGAVPTRYLVPGVDRAAHGAAYELLMRHGGFDDLGPVESMIRALTNDDLGAPAAGIAALADDEIGALRAFAVAEFEPPWWDYLATSLRAKVGGDGAGRAVLVARSGTAITGFVHVHGQRFGPLGVAEAARGQGVGRQLTLAGLAAQRGFGHDEVYFMQAAPDVVAFYLRLGFVPRCTYRQMDLTF